MEKLLSYGTKDISLLLVFHRELCLQLKIAWDLGEAFSFIPRSINSIHVQIVQGILIMSMKTVEPWIQWTLYERLLRSEIQLYSVVT